MVNLVEILLTSPHKTYWSQINTMELIMQATVITKYNSSHLFAQNEDKLLWAISPEDARALKAGQKIQISISHADDQFCRVVGKIEKPMRVLASVIQGYNQQFAEVGYPGEIVSYRIRSEDSQYFMLQNGDDIIADIQNRNAKECKVIGSNKYDFTQYAQLLVDCDN